jgi:hypothetical protein
MAKFLTCSKTFHIQPEPKIPQRMGGASLAGSTRDAGNEVGNGMGVVWWGCDNSCFYLRLLRIKALLAALLEPPLLSLVSPKHA